MATYPELFGLFADSALRNRVCVACILAAETIRLEDGATANHANRLVWAEQTFAAPRAAADEMLMALLAGNSEATVAQITGATDAAIQTKVDAAVDIFTTGA